MIFTVVLGFRLWYDYTKFRPVYLPVLKNDYKENLRIDEKDIKMEVFYKINISEDVILSKEQLKDMYTKMPIIEGYPILKKQVASKKDRFGPLSDLKANRRIIPLPSDVNSSGINIGDKIEITSSLKKDKESEGAQNEVSQDGEAINEKVKVTSSKVYSLANVIDKIDAKGVSYESQDSSKGNVPKVLMVDVDVFEAKEIEDAIARNENINVRLVPPSYYEGVNLNEDNSSS